MRSHFLLRRCRPRRASAAPRGCRTRQGPLVETRCASPHRLPQPAAGPTTRRRRGPATPLGALAFRHVAANPRPRRQLGAAGGRLLTSDGRVLRRRGGASATAGRGGRPPPPRPCSRPPPPRRRGSGCAARCCPGGDPTTHGRSAAPRRAEARLLADTRPPCLCCRSHRQPRRPREKNLPCAQPPPAPRGARRGSRPPRSPLHRPRAPSFRRAASSRPRPA